MTETLLIWIACLLPRRLAYLAAVRVASAGPGKWQNRRTSTALLAWERKA